ncbi:TetR family transcriptional regulator [Mycolicibacterium sp. CH28]|uniref:TetR/AcrR family transcriptional regulator n=1 Tax=Mycolicibacterium sp. CH28 TaxID=2512237 RepID=UPI00108138B1|nr:TetR/AcrR family transcriptional regulator [Mycolicibacterium sp. CH28]TGD87870.1 TetR family transcriptional regulator [Mycolicibacterium sp. CH28]
MPKIVDHAARREAIVECTWRLIARNGLDATGMREIAAEMGLAHGAISHYFPTKDALLLASYQHVFQRTDLRFEARGGHLTGLAALRALASEMMPLGHEQRLEARVVLPFWERALVAEDFADVHEAGIGAVLARFRLFMAQAVEAGEARADLDVPATALGLLSLISGMQVLAVLNAGLYPEPALTAMFDAFLEAEVVAPRATRAAPPPRARSSQGDSRGVRVR